MPMARTPIHFRLEPELLARVDKYSRQLADELGFTVTRTDTVRRLLAFGLKNLEDPEFNDAQAQGRDDDEAN